LWTAFLRSLVKRGLKGVRLVISDAHEGVKQAIGTVLTGTTWQRCRVHFMRNLLATVPHGTREAIAAIVRTIFAQPDHSSAMAQLRKVAGGLRPRFPRAAALLEDAAEDILAYRHLPLKHQRQLHSTNPLERLNKEITRRSNVVGIFPNPAAVIRLVGAILLEQDDEWAGRAALLQRGVDEAIDAARALEHGAGDSRGHGVARETTGVGACGKPARRVFQEVVGGLFRPRPRQRPRCLLTDGATEFQPLDGTLPRLQLRQHTLGLKAMFVEHLGSDTEHVRLTHISAREIPPNCMARASQISQSNRRPVERSRPSRSRRTLSTCCSNHLRGRWYHPKLLW